MFSNIQVFSEQQEPLSKRNMDITTVCSIQSVAISRPSHSHSHKGV